MSIDIGQFMTHNNKQLYVTKYYGGSNDGICVQLGTGLNNYITLDSRDITVLIPMLLEVVRDEELRLKRRLDDYEQ